MTLQIDHCQSVHPSYIWYSFMCTACRFASLPTHFASLCWHGRRIISNLEWNQERRRIGGVSKSSAGTDRCAREPQTANSPTHRKAIEKLERLLSLLVTGGDLKGYGKDSRQQFLINFLSWTFIQWMMYRSTSQSIQRRSLGSSVV